MPLHEEKIYVNALAITSDNDYLLLRALKTRYGAFKHAWESIVTDTIDTTDLDEKNKEKIAKLAKKASSIDLHEEYAKLEHNAITILLPEETDYYPQSLLTMPQPPLCLYLQGNALLLNTGTAMLGVVGTRMLSPYGKIVCERIVPRLAQKNITIISGLALGIDTLAHTLTLDNNGATIAVVGNGLGKCYPHQNKDLARAIIEKGGAILSEYHYATEPHKFNFPRRNRIVAGLARALLVIEAPEKSGSLITARYALEMNKDVFAVPGPINSTNSFGTNALIKDGALVATASDDILHYFGLTAPLDKNSPELDYQEKEIIDVLDRNNGTMQTDALLDEYKEQDIAHITALLTQMELKNIIRIQGTNIIKQ